MDEQRAEITEQERFRRFLEEEVWLQIPPEERGKPPMSKAEIEEILGIGPDSV